MPIKPLPNEITERLCINIMEARDRMSRTIYQTSKENGDEKARQMLYRLLDGNDCTIGMLVRVARILDTTASELLEGVA